MSCVVASAFATGFSPVASMSAARTGHTATLLQNGTVLVAAGSDIGVGGTLASAELYTPITNTWVTVGSLVTSRAGHTETLLQNGKVLVTGGHAGTYIASAELYDPATKTWSSAGNMAYARTGHTATRLGNGKVLVTGGQSFDTPGTELYDPATNSWGSAASMTTARFIHTATLLPNGKVLVVGGSGVAPSSSELYDPVTDSWTSTASLAVARWGHTATRLPNGMVLVVGGVKDNIWHAHAELYDAASNTWSGAGYLTAARGNHSEALLPSGKVLIAGGYNGAIEIASAEIYDPATKTWNGTSNMTAARSSHTATALPSGTMLLVGGNNRPPVASLATAEIYNPLAASTTTLSSSLTPSVFGQLVTFTATVAGDVPTGTARFMDGANTLCMDVALSSGQAYCASSTLAVGSQSITAVYSGDGRNASSVSAALTQTVAAAPASPPAITTSFASSITASNALLNGTVSSNGASTTVAFQYGLTSSYGKTVTALQSPLTAGATNAAVWAVTGLLACNTLYHVRVVAANSAGTTNGADATFTSGACVVVPNVALNVTLAGTGAGTVTSTPLGITCGIDCSESYAAGSSVALIGTPAAGAVFVGWSDSCAGKGICTVSMFAFRYVTATFNFLGAGSPYSNAWVQKSYAAYYGRPADPSGLAYWASRMDSEGGSLSSIIAAFGTSDEFNRRYGGLSYVALVTKVYQQALGRDPEQGGLDYYVGELQAGRRTLQSITLDVLNGASGLDALTVANRLDVANHYTGKVALGCPYGSEQTGVNSLTPVTSDSATVWTAKPEIESRCGP